MALIDDGVLIQAILDSPRIETETVPKLIRLIKALPKVGTNTGDLVSRQEVLEKLTVAEEMNTAELLWTLTTRINDLPNIQPEPKRGRWLEHEIEGWEGGGATVCSCCGFGYAWGAFFEVNEFNYCPNCGARMEVSDD